MLFLVSNMPQRNQVHVHEHVMEDILERCDVMWWLAHAVDIYGGKTGLSCFEGAIPKFFACIKVFHDTTLKIRVSKSKAKIIARQKLIYHHNQSSVVAVSSPHSTYIRSTFSVRMLWQWADFFLRISAYKSSWKSNGTICVHGNIIQDSPWVLAVPHYIGWA